MLTGGESIPNCFYSIPPTSPPACVPFQFYSGIYSSLMFLNTCEDLSFPDAIFQIAIFQIAHHFLQLHLFLCSIFHQEHMQDCQWLEGEHSWLLVSQLCKTFSSSIGCSDIYNRVGVIAWGPEEVVPEQLEMGHSGCARQQASAQPAPVPHCMCCWLSTGWPAAAMGGSGHSPLYSLSACRWTRPQPPPMGRNHQKGK